LSWGVESLIRVNAQHVADASLIVNEKRQSGNFEIETRIRGPLYVRFTALRDNNSLIKSTSHDIGSIVREFLDVEKRKAGGSTPFDWVEVTKDGVVVIKTKGSCKFRYGIKQEILVSQTPIVRKS
jgi:hypothetical protein